MRERADAERVRRLAVELGRVVFFDFDPYSQALSKLERGFELDLRDVREMALFERIEPDLYRFPAVDPRGLKVKVESIRE